MKAGLALLFLLGCSANRPWTEERFQADLELARSCAVELAAQCRRPISWGQQHRSRALGVQLCPERHPCRATREAWKRYATELERRQARRHVGP